MPKIEIQRRLTLNLTADDWQLYHSIVGKDAAAADLNKQIAEAINNSSNAKEARVKCDPVLRKHEKFGAADTEGFEMLEHILEEVFPNG